MVRLARSSLDIPKSSAIIERLTSRAIMMSTPLASISLRRVPVFGASIPIARNATAVRHIKNFHTDLLGRALGQRVLLNFKSTDCEILRCFQR